MRSKFELIDEETFEEIMNGINKRSNEKCWTIYSEISKNVINKLRKNGYIVNENLTNTEIKWR